MTPKAKAALAQKLRPRPESQRRGGRRLVAAHASIKRQDAIWAEADRTDPRPPGKGDRKKP